MTETHTALRATLERLAELRATIERIENRTMSDEQFVARYLPYSSTVWSRVNSGTYKGNLETVQRRLDQAAEDIADRIEGIRLRVDHAASFVQTRFAAAVLGAHRLALDDGDQCRIVVALAPPGSGKSTIAEYITQKHSAIFVEGSQSWLTSYKAFCLDVAKAAGKTLTQHHIDQRTAENTLFEALGTKYGTLVIDEANTNSGAIANALKKIINGTNYTIVIFAVPEHWDDFEARNTNEVRQVIIRCQAILRFATVPAKDIESFLSDDYTDRRKEALSAIAVAANTFGAYKTVKRICNRINATQGATFEDVEKAIAHVKLSQDR